MSETKNVLIIGNGFDLACGLPTKYSDFLDYCLFFKANEMNESFNDLRKINKIVINTMESDKYLNHQINNKENFINYLKNNIWLDYFALLYNDNLCGENWIDFEKEISFIIELLDNKKYPMQALSSIISNVKEDRESIHSKNKIDKFLKSLYQLGSQFNELSDYKKRIRKNQITFAELKEILFNELQKLIGALEIYLCEVVEKYDVKSNDLIKEINPNYIINFNYTHTYNKIFNAMEIGYIHVHGECKSNNTIETNNMVMGIDEYNGKIDEYTDYAVFKKYVQRIQKRTSIHETVSYQHNLHVYGHSLDVTDKDILQSIFLNENVKKIVIYCLNKSAEGQYIANLINIIGKNEVVTRYNKDLIEFVAI